MHFAAILFSIGVIASFFGFLPEQSTSLALIPALVIGGMMAVGGIASALIGAGMQRDQAEKAAQLISQSIDEYNAIGVPSEEALKLSLEKYKRVGVITPEMEQAVQQQGSEFQNIASDPQLREAQMAALSELQGIGESGGMRLQDLADREKVLSAIDQRERGARGAIEQDLLQRGAFGSGAEIAMKLANQQAGAQAAREAGLDLAGRADERALQAILSGGQLGGQIRGQEFSEAAQKAAAQDAINRFNASVSADTQARNIAERNKANYFNYGEDQRIADANVGLGNYEEQFNKSLPAQRFAMEMQKTAGKANARAGQANVIQNTPNPYGGIGQTLIGAGGAIAGYGFKDDDEDKLKTSA